MVNARRAAREMALRVLFQLDVGKQPLAEVMDGALEQVRHTVDHPVVQLVHELQAELGTRIEARRADLSTQSLRQVRNVSKSLLAEMNGLIAQVSERTSQLLSSPTEAALSATLSGVQQDVKTTAHRLRRAGVRETLQPELVREMVDEATRKAEHLPASYSRNVNQAFSTASFLHRLVSGVLSSRTDIDKAVAGLSEGWALDRQPAVDRNILRIGAYEILFLPEVPAGASINEAVELAKKFSTAESGRFVNGVLGTLAAAVDKDDERRSEHRIASEERKEDE